MKRLKLNNKGFTLIEMIISMLVLSIFMGLTLGMFDSVGGIFTSSAESNQDKMIGDSVFEVIEKSVKFSTHLEVADSSDKDTKGYDKSIDINNGKIMYTINGTTVKLYNDNFYQGRTVEYFITKANNKTVNLTVNVKKNNNIVYTRKSAIKCINLNLTSTNGLYYTASINNDGKNKYISFDNDKLVVSTSDKSFNFHSQLLNAQFWYNDINTRLYNGAINQAQAQSEISTLFGGWNPPAHSGIDSKYTGVYATDEEMLFGVLNRYYRNASSGVINYPSFDNPSALFKSTYFADKNMVILAYCYVSPPSSAEPSKFGDFIIYGAQRDSLPATIDATAIPNIYGYSGAYTYSEAKLLYHPMKNTWYFQPNKILFWTLEPKNYKIRYKVKDNKIFNTSTTILTSDIDTQHVTSAWTSTFLWWEYTVDTTTDTIWTALPVPR